MLKKCHRPRQYPGFLFACAMAMMTIRSAVMTKHDLKRVSLDTARLMPRADFQKSFRIVTDLLGLPHQPRGQSYVRPLGFSPHTN